jgi:hypothetical protein
LTHDDSKYLSSAPKARYAVRPENDPLSGEPRLRVYVLYADDFRIRALPPRFRDEKSMNAYLERWNPELVGRQIEFEQLVSLAPARPGFVKNIESTDKPGPADTTDESAPPGKVTV